MSDINSIPLGGKLVLYADDILLYHTIKSKEDYMARQKNVDAAIHVLPHSCIYTKHTN